MAELKDNQPREKIIHTIFWIMVVSAAFSLFSNILEIKVLENDSIDRISKLTSELFSVFANLFHFTILILSMIYFIRWFRRAYYNLHQIENTKLEHAEGWAAGAWFIPFINLVRPYEIMKDIWIQTQKAINKTEVEPTSIVGWWWALYIISNILSNIVLRLSLSAHNVNDKIMYNYLNIFTKLVDIAAIIVTINMLKQVFVFEKELYLQHADKTGSVIEEVE